MKPIDILLPLGNGSAHRNLELRYALRSIVRHAIGWRRVVIVGHNPGWLSEDPRVAFFPAPEAEGNKEYRIAAKLLWAFAHTDVSDYVAMWNDDYLLRREIDVRTLKFYHRGPLIEGARRHAPGRYRNALQRTHEQLTGAGLPARHYDVHLPMLYNRRLFTALGDWWERSRKTQCGLVVKSVYANNVLDTPGPLVRDCKLGCCRNRRVVDARIRSRWCFSYGDESLQTGLIPLLERWYPEPCALEMPSCGIPS